MGKLRNDGEEARGQVLEFSSVVLKHGPKTFGECGCAGESVEQALQRNRGNGAVVRGFKREAGGQAGARPLGERERGEVLFGAIEHGVDQRSQQAAVFGEGDELRQLGRTRLADRRLDLQEVLAVREEEELSGVEEADEVGREEVQGPGVGGRGRVAEKRPGGEGLDGVEDGQGDVEELLLQAEEDRRGGHHEAAVDVLHQGAATREHGGLQLGSGFERIERVFGGSTAARTDDHLRVLRWSLCREICEDCRSETGNQGEKFLDVSDTRLEETLVLKH